MSLVCWLSLDDSTLTNKGCGDLEILETVSGYNLTTPINATTLTADGKLGKCRTFNGSNSLIAIGGDDLFSCFTGGSQPFSICFWLYNNDGNGSTNSMRAVYLGDYNTTGNKNINLEKTAAGLVRWYWTSDAAIGAMANTTVAASAWSHICITYSGTVFKCYINGVEKYTKNIVLPVIAKKTSGYFFLGRDQRTGDTAFNGRMNDFRVYNSCLTPKEIKDLYKCLIVYYSFNFEDQINKDGTYPTAAASWTSLDNSGYKPTASFNNIVSNSDTVSGDRSAKFNGSSSYVEKILPGNSDAYTFICWAKFDSTGAYHLMDFRNTANNQGCQPMYCGLNYGLQFYSTNGGSLQPSASTCNWSTSDVDKWFHIACVINTSGAKIYINGTQIAANSTTKTNPAVWGDLPFRLGTRLNGQNWFNGKVAECRVYLSALSADDILDLYQTKAYILRDGTLHASQFIEDDITTFELPTKNYVVKANEFIDGASEVGLYNGTITGLIPQGYTRLEYIQSSGAQYINTGYYWQSEKTKIEADIYITSNSGNQSLWGNEEYQTSSTSNRYFSGIPYGVNGSFSYYIGSTGYSGLSIGVNTRAVVTATTTAAKNITVKVNDTTKINTTYSATCQAHTATFDSESKGLIYIFSNHNSGKTTNYSPTQNVGGMRVYSFKMWDNDILVRDFIPVKNTSDVAGLYDLIEDKFYPSNASTAFTASSTTHTSYALKTKEIIETV